MNPPPVRVKPPTTDKQLGPHSEQLRSSEGTHVVYTHVDMGDAMNATRKMMEQMMEQNPSMRQQLMQDPEAQGILQGLGSAPPAEFEDPQLKTLLEPIRKHKQVGADMFKKRDLDGALTAYQAAVAAAGGTKHGSLAWPQAEKLVFECSAVPSRAWSSRGGSCRV